MELRFGELLIGEAPKLSPELSHHAQRAARMIYTRAGVIVPEHRESAIARHLLSLVGKRGELAIGSLLDSLERDSNHQFWPRFISGFTINHTSFFREPHHFKHLSNVFKNEGAQKIWCASSSTGEEPYSVAMVMNEVFGESSALPPIYATDIDIEAINQAKRGAYEAGRIDAMGDVRVKRHFLRGVDKNAGLVRVKKTVRNRVSFDVFNLNAEFWPNLDVFDVVFCRNTMIYFDQQTQVKLLKRFAASIRPGGYLYIGHSESVTTLTNEFKLLGQTVYQRKK